MPASGVFASVSSLPERQLCAATGVPTHHHDRWVGLTLAMPLPPALLSMVALPSGFHSPSVVSNEYTSTSAASAKALGPSGRSRSMGLASTSSSPACVNLRSIMPKLSSWPMVSSAMATFMPPGAARTSTLSVATP